MGNVGALCCRVGEMERVSRCWVLNVLCELGTIVPFWGVCLGVMGLEGSDLTDFRESEVSFSGRQMNSGWTGGARPGTPEFIESLNSGTLNQGLKGRV